MAEQADARMVAKAELRYARVILVGMSLLGMGGSSVAQGIPNIAETGKNSGGAPAVSKADIQAAFGTKADAANGVLTNPTLNGPSITAPTFAGLATSPVGLPSGTLWNNGGLPSIIP